MSLFSDTTLVHHLNRLSVLLDTSSLPALTRAQWVQEEIAAMLALLDHPQERAALLDYLEQFLPVPTQAPLSRTVHLLPTSLRRKERQRTSQIPHRLLTLSRTAWRGCGRVRHNRADEGRVIQAVG